MTITPNSRAPSAEAGGFSIHGLGADLRSDGIRPPWTNYFAGVLLTFGRTVAGRMTSRLRMSIVIEDGRGSVRPYPAERRPPREVAAARATGWYSQSLAGVLVLLPGQFACAIPLAPRRSACWPQGIGCPWHDRTAVIIYYAVLAAVIATVVVVVWLRAVSGKPGRKARRMRMP